MSKEAISRALVIAVFGTLVAVPTALAKPPAAAGPPADQGNPVVSYVFKGTYLGLDQGPIITSVTEFTVGIVNVDHGNAHVRKNGLVGTPVRFDFAGAAFVVADTNADGVSDLNDVQFGDRVVVKSRLPLRDPGPQPFKATQLVDQTHSG